MNTKFLTASLIAISASMLFMAGCGPQDANFAQDSAVANMLNQDNQGFDAQDQAPAMGQEEAQPAGQEAQPQGDQDAEPQAEDMDQGGAQPQGQEGGQAQGPAMGQQMAQPQGPAMGQQPQAEGGCPTGNCEIPPDPNTNRTVQLPAQVSMQQTQITPTGEKQLATDLVDYHTTRHIWQPSERHHTVHKHRNLVRRHFTKVVYHPTMRRINRVVNTSSATDQVMPTEEVTAPPVDYGCVGAAPQPVVRPVVVPVVRRVLYARPYLYGRFLPGRPYPYRF